MPFSLLIKPAGPDCNLNCRYCFYSGKDCLFGQGPHRMSGMVLEKMISDYLKLGFTVSNFAWQGGEPTLMGLDFYKKTVELQKKYGKDGQIVSNSLQTNGILLDDDWCKFLNEYKFLVGISLDGPAKYHDYYRLNRSGEGTFDKVMAAVEKCKKHKVEFNVLVLLNDKNVVDPDGLFDFFISQGIKFLQFIPCVENDPETDKITPFSVTPEQYGSFILRIFELWKNYGPDKLSIRIFDSMMNYILNQNHTNCTFRWHCDDYIVIEHNGDAYCCDFFVEPEYKLGNIMETPVEKLLSCDVKKEFSERKKQLSDKCLLCRHSMVCRGGCLKDRLVSNRSFSDVSYFCESYKLIFDKILPELTWIIGTKF
ncbi:MAG: anaerobic sulfatase maturase [Phycisphaerae bacterium]|jgi:uncharacterized protein